MSEHKLPLCARDTTRNSRPKWPSKSLGREDNTGYLHHVWRPSELRYELEKQLLDGADELFEKAWKDKDAEAAERKQDVLYKQIGLLQVENEFLKKYRQLYGTEPKL